MKSFDVTSFRDFPLVYKFGDFLKAKIFLHIGNELAHFQRCDAGIGPILKIPRSNSERFTKKILAAFFSFFFFFGCLFLFCYCLV